MRSSLRIFPGILSLAVSAAVAAPAPVKRDVAKVYAELCSGCHGEHMEGGKGPSLLGARFRDVRNNASLLRTIRDGRPANGMPGFAAALNDAETHAMINYLHEVATRTAEPMPQQERPVPEGVQHSEVEDYRIETVAAGFDVPWSLTFLPDGRMLVTERVGRLRVIDHGKLLPEPIRGLPTTIMVRDEAGLMSVVADPDYRQNGWIYLSYCDTGPKESSMTKVIRGRLRDGALVDQQVVFAIPPEKYQPSTVLYGGRLAFKGKYLFISVGERGMETSTTGQAQDLALPNGKIHRVFHDGSIPPDNPFVKKPGAFQSIWAYGVRNPQGLAINPRDGEVWESEHGPRGGDELNHIRRGRNYGWPVITYGINYNGTPVSDKTAAPGMEQPVINWTSSIAASEIGFYTGDKFPHWRGNLFVGSLAQQKFLRIVLDGGRVAHREEVFHGLGRIRDIKTGPDGDIYLALEYIGKLGRVVRLVPAK
ncbi:MAG TPA: PQQ-dependent sugar dehydrogenase [Opitutus sp.]|nr:PQQ-dependent sugar dehydrogenase [Opitutus sp.]